uniref:Uncharacterized protein n=1 Tax=Arundo donax TaxID=35708 RepID=A0A0A9BME9_ARUDO
MLDVVFNEIDVRHLNVRHIYFLSSRCHSFCICRNAGCRSVFSLKNFIDGCSDLLCSCVVCTAVVCK